MSDPELSGSHPDGRDPALLSETVEKLVAQSGWSGELAVHGVFARWAEIVGEEVASHCRPESYAEGRLRVRADSTAWAIELRLQAATVLKRVNEELGHDTVTVIDFAGPGAPSWVKGRRTMPGRGPRDTYG
jgi:predicted nucleic acid-binding Zn ribbon protein